MSQRTVAVAIALSCAAALLSAPAGAHAAKGMELALSDEGAFVDQRIGDRQAAFAAARQLNATRMRILVQWSRVSDANDPSPSAAPYYDWAPIDDAVDLAARAGMRTMLTLTGPAPAYAAGNGQVSYPIVRPDPQRYADFVRAAVAHFKGRVDRYAIWNEPNYPAWLAPQGQSPQIYRALYEAGYAAVKSVDPAARVLIGETVPYGGKVSYGRPAKRKRLGLATAPLRWLRAVACVDKRYRPIGHCTPLKADGYAHHPYELALGRPPTASFPGKDNAPIQELPRLGAALGRLARAKALTDARGRPLSIYLTESGYFVTGRRRLADAKRAKYLPQQFDVAARTPGVRSMLQYNLYLPPGSPFSTGLLNADGSPLPEWTSLLRWSSRAAASGLIKRNTGPIVLPPRQVESPWVPPEPSGP